MSLVRSLTIQRLMTAVLFILIFAMAVRVPLDTDMWWHIRSGEYILDHRDIPRTDPFSFTRQGERWIDHGWAAQVVLYGLYHLSGGAGEPGDSGNIGLALYTAALATLGMAFVYAMGEGSVYVRAFTTVIGAAAAAVFWSPRPQMFSFTLGALVLYLLYLYKWRGVDRLWLLPLLMALWANLHGGFAIGFIFLIGTLLGEGLGNLLGRPEDAVVRGRRLGKLAAITALCVPAIVLNPNGVRMLAYPFQTVGIGALQDFIQEWASPNFHQPQTWPFAALLLGVLAAVGLDSRRLDWTDAVLVCGTGLMALMAGRNIAVFAIAAAPVLARHVEAWLADHGWQIRPVRRVQGRMLALNWILLIVVLIGALAKIGAVLSPEVVRKAQERSLPVEIAARLDTSPPPGPMFNSYNWGGYLMFAAPQVPVFVDGRTDLYDDAFLRDYLDIALAREGWEAGLDEWKIGFAVIESDSILATVLRLRPETWREQQFDDGRSSLFVRLPGGGAND